MNIPSALSPRECAVLARVASHKRVVEAGALLGFSTLMLERAAASVVSVDRHEGYTGPTLGLFLANLARYGQGRVQTRVGDALDILPTVDADVAFIDLTGAEGLTRAVLAALAPAVQVAMVHDCGRPRCDGVERAILDSGWHPVGLVDTLVILERAC